MHSLTRSIAAALATFVSSLVGMGLQWIVPAQVLTEAKGTVGAMGGLVTLLLALVLGLLIWTAFSVYSMQRSEAQSLGPVVIELDLALEQYGPEGVLGRLRLRQGLKRSRLRFFGDAERGPQEFTFEESRATMLGMNSYFDSLQPSTDTQRQLLSTARDLARKLTETQMLMARQLVNPLPPLLLLVVVLWASALFLGNGLTAPLDAVAVGAHLIGALAIASAIFLILELSEPYTGVFRIPPTGLDRLMLVLGDVPTETPA